MRIKHYLYVYWNMLFINLKTLLEYRLNFWLQMIYGPMYSLTLYLVMITAYSKAPVIAGWNQQQGTLLFLVFQLLYLLYYFLFMRGIRELLWSDIRLGRLDTMLTKPINPQFYISIAKPDLHQLLLLLATIGLFIRQLLVMHIQLSLVQLVLFLATFTMGIAIAYFVVSAYATAGFYVTKAAQILEFFDKATDSAQYPMPIFPQSIQVLAFTVIPIAYLSYVPTLFLLGRGSLLLFASAVVMLIASIIINQWLWKRGLQHYSSASS